VEGEVVRSVLFPGVHIGPGAVVEDSIVMHDARIAPGARLRRAIVDKRVIIGRGAVLGRSGPGGEGLCVVGKGSVIPADASIGARTLIEIGVSERDYPGREIAAGSVIRPR